MTCSTRRPLRTGSRFIAQIPITNVSSVSLEGGSDFAAFPGLVHVRVHPVGHVIGVEAVVLS